MPTAYYYAALGRQSRVYGTVRFRFCWDASFMDRARLELAMLRLTPFGLLALWLMARPPVFFFYLHFFRRSTRY